MILNFVKIWIEIWVEIDRDKALSRRKAYGISYEGIEAIINKNESKKNLKLYLMSYFTLYVGQVKGGKYFLLTFCGEG